MKKWSNLVWISCPSAICIIFKVFYCVSSRNHHPPAPHEAAKTQNAHLLKLLHESRSKFAYWIMLEESLVSKRKREQVLTLYFLLQWITTWNWTLDTSLNHVRKNLLHNLVQGYNTAATDAKLQFSCNVTEVESPSSSWITHIADTWNTDTLDFSL